MNKKLIKLMIVIFTGIVLLTACNNNEKNKTVEDVVNDNDLANDNGTVYPLEIEVTDSEGNIYTQVFEKAPERIITNNLSSIEILLQLGLKDKIVGTTKPDNVVTGEFADDIEDLLVIGDKMTISKEVIAGHTPDIVIGRAVVFNDESIGSVATLNDLGIQAYIQTASNMTSNPPLRSVIDDVLTLGKIFNVNERAKEYAKELEGRYEKVIEQVNSEKDIDKQVQKLNYL